MSTTAPRPPAARPSPKPAPSAWDAIKTILKPIASLQLTVGLLVLSLGLVFFGTVAQVDFGIWTVVNKYFYSWVAWVPFQLFVRFGQKFLGVDPEFSVGGGFPYPGGWVIGGLLMVNLIAAHLVRFKVSWKRTGILMIHAGLMILLLGEFLSSQFKVEGRMSIDMGQTKNYIDTDRKVELAFVDSTDPVNDKVVVIPEQLLRGKKRISHPELPVDVEVVEFMPNSELVDAPELNNKATAGAGLDTAAELRAEVSGIDPKQNIDAPSAYIRLIDKDTGKDRGTYLVSLWFSQLRQPIPPEVVELDNKPYSISLRLQRRYLPFKLHLIEFRFDRYVGTNTPLNYSSDVRLVDSGEGQDRQVRISMNEPLRYRGETFYQASFDERTEKTTVLSAVRNRAWTMPYLACAMVALGLLFHFGLHLNGFLKRRGAAGAGHDTLRVLHLILSLIGRGA